MRLPITIITTGKEYFKEVHFYTTGEWKGYIMTTFSTPDEGEIDLIFRVHDSENGKDNTLVWTSRSTKHINWIEMVLTVVSRRSKLKEIIGYDDHETLAKTTFTGYNGTVSLGSMLYELNNEQGIKECYERYYKGE